MLNPYLLSDALLSSWLLEDAPTGDLTGLLLGFSERRGVLHFTARDPMRVCGCEEALRMGQLRGLTRSGAMAASMGGLDVLAFSGGIGENDAVLREQVCNRLAWTGLRIDEERNRNADGKAAYAIHAPDSRVEIWVIPTDEGRVAAREAAQLLQTLKAGGQTTPSLAPASVA